MADDDYEIVSHKDIERLKEEIKDLREGKTSTSGSNVIQRLDAMLDLFREASASAKEERPIYDKIDEINQKIETLLDQNQKIAEGVLAIADLIHEKHAEHMPQDMDEMKRELPPMSMPPPPRPIPSIRPPPSMEPPQDIPEFPRTNMPQPGAMPPLPPMPRPPMSSMPPLPPPPISSPSRPPLNDLPPLSSLPPRRRLFRK